MEQEGGMDYQGGSISGGMFGGIGALIVAILGGVGWAWRQRQERPRADAEQSADISRARLDSEAAQGLGSVIEMMRQELSRQQAMLIDTRTEQEQLRITAIEAQTEVTRLRGELSRLQVELEREKGRTESESRRADRLQKRVETLEGVMRSHGMEPPR